MDVDPEAWRYVMEQHRRSMKTLYRRFALVVVVAGIILAALAR